MDAYIEGYMAKESSALAAAEKVMGVVTPALMAGLFAKGMFLDAPKAARENKAHMLQYMRDQGVRNSAITGGVVGSLAGYLSGDSGNRLERAIAGGAIGTGLGAGGRMAYDHMAT